jgi:DNA gyrase inhibitor YacG
MTTEQRACPACGTEFTWTSAAPRQRFCSTRCKHRWQDAHRRQAAAALSHGDTRLPAGQPPGDDPRATTNDARGAGPGGDQGPATLAATPACPHCRQAVAIVAWLVPPAAASVATPQRHAVTARDNQ